ncbi:protein timeless [Rhopalosiphum maidis]|uniref:protein timeless n=1 Tax=Rhopalosiphum maidis TaxID=43146 RepID=UPI000EFEDD0E|nr:protein timeless [Rhopalosiphum maidis]
MDEIFKNSNTQNMFAHLGTRVGNDYVPSKNCFVILMHIYEKLNSSEESATHLRQIIGFSQLLSKHLIPMFIAVNNDNIIDILLKILVSLISPIECLMLVEKRAGEKGDISTLLRMNWMMMTSKATWTDLKAIKRIMQIIKEHMKKLSCYPARCTNNQSISFISNCLRLIKNILHIPNEQYQNTLLWMIFSEQFDEIIIALIANSNRGHWAVLIIELIALIFKNQHVDEMSKQIIKMNETIRFDSSEDNESNTSSLYPKNGRNSSPENVSDFSNTEDNDNENNLNVNQMIKNLRQNNLMDGQDNSSKEIVNQNSKVNTVKDKLETKTAVEDISLLPEHDLKKEDTEEKNDSKNSNRESRRNSFEQIKLEFEMKTYKPTFASDICRKKVVSRKKKYTKKIIKTKLKLPTFPIQFNVPNEMCIISYFLQKFTVCFLQNGFNTLVDELYYLLTTNSQQHIDTSLYFWLLTYFCRFCKLSNIELKLVRRIVSFKLISFIVHEGLKISEQLTIAKRQKSPNIHLKVRHLHLAVMAIKEVIKTIEFYRQTAVDSLMYADLIKDLQNSGNNSPESITWAKDLKSLFTLLIRYYDSDIQIIEYLHDLIVTNHMVLSLFDTLKDCWNLNDNITAYIKKFAVPDLMYKYGVVLQNYEKNSEIINESVFTMMHHVSKVENTTALFQPIILKTFLKMFENNDIQYKRWSSLIENVLNKFLKSTSNKDLF